MVDKTRKEIWKPIGGWEGIYEISNFQRVRSWRKSFKSYCAPQKPQTKKLPCILNSRTLGNSKWCDLGEGSSHKGFNITKNLFKYFPEVKT